MIDSRRKELKKKKANDSLAVGVCDWVSGLKEEETLCAEK